MAATFTKYTSYNQYVHDGTINLNNTGKVMFALVTSGYTFSAAHTVWADVSANEAATGDGYTTGGAALASLSVTAVRFDSASPTWTALTKTFRYGVLYINDTVNAIVKPLIGCVLFDATPANITMTGGDFTYEVDATGWITF
jgi:hypothetical protein